MKIGFIGLGNMGQPIARNLIAAGHELTVYNRTISVAEEFASLYDTKFTISPKDAAKNADILITMLANDLAVESVIFGTEIPGALPVLKPDTIHISMSTISFALSKKLAQTHENNYIAAPVFGRPEAAEKAEILVVAGGDKEKIERCLPVFNAISQGVFKLEGDPWNANVVKLTGNFLIASMLEALGEAFTLAKKSGIPPEYFLEIVNTSLFKSPIYANYGTIMAQEKYKPAGFKLNLGLKDIKLVMEVAEAINVPLPIASLVRDRFLSAIATGKSDLDWSAIAKVNEENAGIFNKQKEGEREKREGE